MIEALAHGCPVITTKGTSRSGWWTDIGVEPLEATLKEAMGLIDKERHAMGNDSQFLV